MKKNLPKILQFSLPFTICLFLLFVAFYPLSAQEITQIGYVQKGKASYYSDDRKGAITQSGERYDPNALEAAHAKIAFNSLVKITNLENGSEIIVRINDRSTSSERIIDMTKAAADGLGMTDKKTVIEVKIELIQLGVPRNNAREILEDAYRRISTKPIEEEVEITKEEEISARYEEKNIEVDKNKPDNEAVREKKKIIDNKKIEKTQATDHKKNKGVLSTTNNPSAKSKNKDKISFDPTSTYTPDGEKVSLKGFGVQIASYDDIQKALRDVPKIEKLKVGQVYIQAGWANGQKTYRILVGNFKSKELAQKTADKLNKQNYKSFPKKHFE
ncbi:MAG: septal ring lytic transglycosylase RlpA family protein [Thermoflexibacter sp.]|jgi:rare lipoprotein A|nr:septal ring lytic transglycosylase RlpA family protein [Thermoflexibacter sp.]